MRSLLLFLLFGASTLHAQLRKFELPVIPRPVLYYETKADSFVFSEKTVILDEAEVFEEEISVFNYFLKKLHGFTLDRLEQCERNDVIRLDLDSARKIKPSSYTMKTGALNIQIKGDRDGVYYALISLVQLICKGRADTLKIPCTEIKDHPRFQWRGMHLDVCRHFFTKEEVMKYLDYLTLYKFNVFHWHLTEDQGWRIEIKKYPKLTEIGSTRKQTLVGKPSPAAQYDNTPHGGYYTQQDIKEIVEYARKRHITVVPEIEMPGHSLAALAAYPQYSCTGLPVNVGTSWGVFDDVYCAGNDSTFAFLENILSEVCELFPGKYIHIGGDECPKVRWKLCPKCQKRMKTEKLKDENQLQSYFIRRIEKFLNSKGKQIVGWDEILEGGLAPNATVMSWRGTEGGIAAANQNHYVVMSPGKPCYFDHYQSEDRSKEPLAIGGFNHLSHIYTWNPLPANLSAEKGKYILGAQGNVWTEYIATFKHVEYMIFPRMCALSEVLWNPSLNKSYTGFIGRLTYHTKLLDRLKVHYCRNFLTEK